MIFALQGSFQLTKQSFHQIILQIINHNDNSNELKNGIWTQPSKNMALLFLTILLLSNLCPLGHCLSLQDNMVVQWFHCWFYRKVSQVMVCTC